MKPKKTAAEWAAALIEDGMVVGLGTGSTASLILEPLAARIRQGLRVVGIPTSERTAEQARAMGITLSTLADHARVDLTIDGADEVELGTLNLIKGRGGALLREKIVASASARLVIVVDESKLVERLGRGVVPIVPPVHEGQFVVRLRQRRVELQRLLGRLALAGQRLAS